MLCLEIELKNIDWLDQEDSVVSKIQIHGRDRVIANNTVIAVKWPLKYLQHKRWKHNENIIVLKIEVLHAVYSSLFPPL